MTSDHDALREALGAYTLGALDPAERPAVERHLRDCGTCRDEFTSLALLPDLLGMLTPDEAGAVLGPPPRVDPASVLAAAGREQRRLRRSLRSWRVAAAATAVALLAVALAPSLGQGRATVFEPRPAVGEAAEAQGRVHVTAEPWGMRVRIDVRDLPARRGYGLWAVRDDGHKALAASWSAPPGGAVVLDGSCYVSVDELVRFEVLDPDDEVLLTFESV